MNNNNLILFIIIIINIYLLYKVNKKEDFTNSKESFTNSNETITESIKNLGCIAKRIQEANGDFEFPANVKVRGNLSVTGDSEFSNIRIPLGKGITFEGPDGKATLLYFNQTTGGLEITQSGGASTLRLYVENAGGFDIRGNSIQTAGSSKLRLNNDIFTTGKVVADGSVDTKTALRLLDGNSLYKGGLFDQNNNTYIESRMGGIRGYNKDNFDWLIPLCGDRDGC